MSSLGAQMYKRIWSIVEEMTGNPDARTLTEASMSAHGIDLDELRRAWETMDMDEVQRVIAAQKAAIEGLVQ